MNFWSCPQLRLLVASEGRDVRISNLDWDSCYPAWGLRVPQSLRANRGIGPPLDHATYSFQTLSSLSLIKLCLSSLYVLMSQ
jgi:hypothetical protein